MLGRPTLPWRRLAAKAVGGAALIIGWWVLLAPSGLGGPVGLVWVSGLSMQPTLYTGDLSVLYERDSYEVGDIVAFDIPAGGTVIHRVVAVEPDGYRFQGDNRDLADPWLLDEGSIRGKQVFSVPGLAQTMAKVSQPPILAGLVAALVVVTSLWKTDDAAAASTARRRQAHDEL